VPRSTAPLLAAAIAGAGAAVGFVYSFSRLSAIFSSYIIAATLERAGSVGVFVLISTAMLVVALTVGLFGPRTRGLALEHI
jgi:putative MFS transporter